MIKTVTKSILLMIVSFLVLLTLPAVSAFADGDGVRLSGVRLTEGGYSYDDPYFQKNLPLTISSDGTVFTATDTLGVDFMNRGERSPYDGKFLLHYTANVDNLYDDTFSGVWAKGGIKSEPMSVSMFNKAPYDTDPYYIIWTKTLYDHLPTPGDTTGTKFTIRIPKWESIYQPEKWYGRWNSLYVGTKKLSIDDFKPVAGKADLFEYIAWSGVTFPYTLSITVDNYRDAKFYVDEKLVSGSGGLIWDWQKDVVLTENKPYVDLRYVPPSNTDTKYRTLLPATWRIRVVGKGGTTTTQPPVKNKFTDKSNKPVAVNISSISNKSWTGKSITPKLTVKADGKTLKLNTDYTVSYSKNINIGKATATIKGKGNYKGTMTTSFNIVPQKPIAQKPTVGKKQIKVAWKKYVVAHPKVTGYEVRYKEKNAKTWLKPKSVKGATKTSLTIKQLKSKKAYQVQVRSYKTVSGVKYYSNWSTTKTTAKTK